MDKNLRDIVNQYLKIPVLFTIFFAIVTVAMFFISIKAGVLMAVSTVIYFWVIFSISSKWSSKIYNQVIDFAFEQGQIQKKLLKELSIPYTLVDKEGRILWYNGEFKDMVGRDFSSRKFIYNIFSELSKSTLRKTQNKAKQYIDFDGHNYRIELKRVRVEELEIRKQGEIDSDTILEGDQMLFALYFYDETEMITYKEACENQKLVVGVIYIDNYEEVMESTDEVRRSLLMSLVERKISKYMQNVDGIVKKLEKDKFIAIFPQKHLSKLQENKFSVLDEVRAINVGNEIAVTLSIGLGVEAPNYIKTNEYAQMAMDLALGRGGDQAVVKRGPESILYYGGKSKGVEKNTRVKARVKAHALREMMLTKDKVLIMGHKIPDIDCLGAAIGIYRLSKMLDRETYIVMNEPTSSIKPVMHEMINNHSIYGDDLFVTNEQAMLLIDDSTMLVVVDVNRPCLTECEDLLKYVKTIVVLDHHRQTNDSIQNAVLSYVEPYASSACEMVTEILQYSVDKPDLKAIEADALYSGILVDTDNFVSKTGVRTFEAAAFLRRSGADMSRVRKMFREEISIYQKKAEGVRRAEKFLDDFAISICDGEGVESPTILGAQIANDLLDIKGIRASFVLTDLKDKIYISARSIDMNVQIIMERLGGGGHLNMAATQIPGVTIEEAMTQLKELLEQMREEREL